MTKKSKAVLVNAVEKAGKDKWEMCRDDIILQEKRLGSGHFGDVMKGILKPSNTPVAVKSCKGNVSQTVKQKFLAEAEILKPYDHPNIVRLIGVCADREPVFIGKSGYNVSTIPIVVTLCFVRRSISSYSVNESIYMYMLLCKQILRKRFLTAALYSS